MRFFPTPHQVDQWLHEHPEFTERGFQIAGEAFGHVLGFAVGGPALGYTIGHEFGEIMKEFGMKAENWRHEQFLKAEHTQQQNQEQEHTQQQNQEQEHTQQQTYF